jgi:hypothetical protein
MKKCCGQTYPDNYNFCTKCGAKLDSFWGKLSTDEDKDFMGDLFTEKDLDFFVLFREPKKVEVAKNER